MKPRVLFVGRTRYRLPLNGSLRRKFDALGRELDVRVLASAEPGAARGAGASAPPRPFPLRRLDGPAFWLSLPFRVARELRRARPDAVAAQSVYEGAASLVGRRLARRRVPVVVEVHGDWRTSMRLYGSPLRRLLAPAGDRIAVATLRRADAIRTVSGYTTQLVQELGLEPSDTFSAFMDLDAFVDRPPAPLPEEPQVLFVGVLELYKNIDGLAAAWRLAAPRVPEARLRIVGSGSRAPVVEELVVDLPGQTKWTPSLPAEEVARALDESTVLVLPSRSEGMGRVVVEALCRGRPVVGTRVGGIAELVRDDENGLLVEAGDTRALADTLARVLGDRSLAARLAANSRSSGEPLLTTPEEYAAAVRASVEQAAPTLSTP
jgi:glycosyltransferase involved in cell wall biosynthesis